MFSGIWTSVVANKENITLTVALLGASLGVLNLVRDHLKSRRQERVKIKVVPKLAVRTPTMILSSVDKVPGSEAYLAVEVVNQSYFPVYLEALYIRLDDPRGRICVVMYPQLNPQKEWPVKLERNEAVTIYAPAQTVLELVKIGARGVYVKTSTDLEFEGTSKVISDLLAQHRRLPKTDLGTVDWESLEYSAARS